MFGIGKEKDMYDKRYIVESIEEFGGHNPIYEDMEGCIAYPAYLKVGERGWFIYKARDYFDTVHKVHLSPVKRVQYLEDQIIVTTKNTQLTFRVADES